MIATFSTIRITFGLIFKLKVKVLNALESGYLWTTRQVGLLRSLRFSESLGSIGDGGFLAKAIVSLSGGNALSVNGSRA
ncbi:uncharacterized protein [Bemisia tabaci]|uniref:uncharacterized protein n=1 Tax=Bemisia tabaci TaxID=7038 RepID=UPI003B27D1F8